MQVLACWLQVLVPSLAAGSTDSSLRAPRLRSNARAVVHAGKVLTKSIRYRNSESTKISNWKVVEAARMGSEMPVPHFHSFMELDARDTVSIGMIAKDFLNF